MKILFLGDVHGEFSCLCANLVKLLERGVTWDRAIVCGDFGFYEGIKIGFPKKSFASLPPLWFLDGNHENHTFLNDAKKLRNSFGVKFIERGTIWTIDNTKIGFMGGAFNVDRPQEKNGLNFPSRIEISDFIKKINNENGIDVLVCHSCPGGMGIIRGHPVFQQSAKRFIEPWGYKVYDIENCGEEPLKTLYDGLLIKPKHFVFGHYHVSLKAKIGTTMFYCVGCASDYPFSPIILDTETKEIY